MSAVDDMWLGTSIRAAWAHHKAGRLVDAESLYRQILSRRPDHAPALHLLGLLAHQTGHHDDALQLITRAIALDPRDAAAQNDLGLVLEAKGRLQDARAAFAAAADIDPGIADVHYNLGSVLARLGELDDAMGCYRRALELSPDLADAWNGLGNAHKDTGMLDEAIACFRRAIALCGDEVNFVDNLIFTLQYHPNFPPQRIHQEHLAWQQRFAPAPPTTVHHPNDRGPERRLRIGYVSPHFNAHAECFFVLPLLEAHDPEMLEVHAYSTGARADEITERYRRAIRHWHQAPPTGISDAALAEQIRADGIDVLVDLTMHMSGSRLRTFALRPAPVQFTWLAYPGSAGLDAIGYRLTDRFLDPPDQDVSSWSVEEPIRLPDVWCCYEAVGGTPAMNELPALSAGHVTFGALNNPCKANDAVLDLWAGVLNAVDGSRLLMNHASTQGRERVRRRLERNGVAPQRVEFVKPLPRPQYLELYHRIDLALDTFPYNGITTTCDALWMGVPVLTLPGSVPQSRAGRGLLNMVGLDELAPATPQDFVRTAAQWSRGLPRLAALRKNLRATTLASPLMDAPRFARAVERAYRDAWRRWCAPS